MPRLKKKDSMPDHIPGANIANMFAFNPGLSKVRIHGTRHGKKSGNTASRKKPCMSRKTLER